QPDLDRTPLTGFKERLPAEELAAFLGNPHARYPDGRMPRIPLTPDAARDIAAYLLLWSKPIRESPEDRRPTAEEIQAVSRRLGVHGMKETATRLLAEKRCAQCHHGLGQGIAADVPLTVADDRKGCLSGRSLPRFTVGESSRKAIAAYRSVAAREK